MYIPPNGTYFRLVGKKSGLAIYSNDAKEPKVMHAELHQNNKDQLFTLIHGTGERVGLYALKGYESQKVLFSRSKGEPPVGHVAGNGDSDDNWFNIVVGTGPRKGAFRMVFPATDTEIYSSKQLETRFGNLEGYEDFTDAYFYFDFEAPVITGVKFDLDAGRIDDSVQTITLFTATFANHTGEHVDHDFVFNSSYKDNFRFAHKSGKFPLSHGALFESRLPFVSGGKIKLSSTKDMYAFETEGFNKVAINKKIPTKVPPGKTATGEVQMKKGTVKVPFTIKLVSPATNTETETRGLWTGELYWNMTYPVEFA
ncbi:hypothetical protein C8Q77DRAFT_1157307 [Trametes polyzona]|nr:hypothetical protein C8Q77DRAFT_1157307 [Trametes polyzona]